VPGSEYIERMAQPIETAFPAEAGIHDAAPETIDKWVPAFAGNANLNATVCVPVPER
jgi:hypothetical protein